MKDAPSSTKKHDSAGLTYKDSGVVIDAGNALVERIKPAAAATRRTGSMAGLGGFGGLFDLKATGYRDPILVSATDGCKRRQQRQGHPDSKSEDSARDCLFHRRPPSETRLLPLPVTQSTRQIQRDHASCDRVQHRFEQRRQGRPRDSALRSGSRSRPKPGPCRSRARAAVVGALGT